MASGLLTLLIALLVALALYLILTFALIPLIRHHRQRYDQYSPLGRIDLSSARDRLALLLSGFGRRVVRASTNQEDEEELDMEDGEEMFEFTPTEEAARRSEV